MHKALRQWLVGMGLLVALLALAVPAFAQNAWNLQNSPWPFPTPVTGVAINPAGGVDAVTAGTNLGTAGGTLGHTYFDNTVTYGDNWTDRHSVSPTAPDAQDFYTSIYDVANWGWYAGTYQTGLWQWDQPGNTFSDASLGEPTVNQSVMSVAFNTNTLTDANHHMVYFGTWGDGVYNYTYTAGNGPHPGAFAKLIDFTSAPANGFPLGARFVHKIIVVPPAAGRTALTVFAATDGGGVLKGVSATGADAGPWAWSQVNVGNGYVFSIAWNGATGTSYKVYAGTSNGHIYSSTAGGSWTEMTYMDAPGGSATSLASTSQVRDILYYNGDPSGPMMFAATYGANVLGGVDGQFIWRYDFTLGYWFPVSCDWNSWADYHHNMNALAANYDAGAPAGTWLYFGSSYRNGSVMNGYFGRIKLVQPAAATPTYNNVVGQSPNPYLGVSTCTNHNPPVACGNFYPNAYYAYTTGAMPPGISLAQDPAGWWCDDIHFPGTLTTDCTYNFTVDKWDGLGNHSQDTILWHVAPALSVSILPTSPVPLGAALTATATASGTSGNDSYVWTVQKTAGPGAPLPAVPLTLPMTGNVATFVPTAANYGPGTYTFTAVLTDNNCADPLSNTNTATQTVVVYAPLTVNPAVCGVSGAHVQLQSGAAGGITTTCVNGYTIQWNMGGAGQFADATQGPTKTTYWNPASGPEPCLAYSYTNTGTYDVVVTVTDCAGTVFTGHVIVNWTGTMAISLTSSTNPAPTGTQVTFAINVVGGVPPYTVSRLTASGGASGTFAVTTPITPPGAGPLFTEGLTWSTYAWPCGTYPMYYQVVDSDVPNDSAQIAINQKIYRAFTGLSVANISPVCNRYTDSTVTVRVQATGGLAGYLYVVDWGDGSIYSQAPDCATFHDFTHVYATPGAYTVTAWATDSQTGMTCAAFASCGGQSGGGIPVTLTNTTGPINIYAPPTNALININVGPPYGVQTGCVQVAQGNGPAGGNYPVTVSFTPGAPATWDIYLQWHDQWGYGSNWTAQTVGAPTATWNVNFVNHGTASNPSVYAVQGAVWDNTANYCREIFTSTMTVTAYTLPLTVGTPLWGQECGTQVVHFDATASVSNGILNGHANYQYFWDFGDGSPVVTTTVPTTTHTYNAPGGNIYNAQLTVNDWAMPLCAAVVPNTANRNYFVQVLDPINVSINSPTSTQTICTGGGVNFNVSMSGGAPGTLTPSFVTTGPAAVGVGGGYPNYFLTFPTAGTYTVAFKATSTVAGSAGWPSFTSPYACTTSAITVNVYDPINGATVTFVPTETSGYLPIPIAFTATWVGGTDITVSYSFTRNAAAYTFPADYLYNNPLHPYSYTGATSPFVTPTPFVFTQAGTYVVTQDVFDHICNVHNYKQVTIQIIEPAPLSVTTAATPTAGNGPLTVSFSSNPAGGVKFPAWVGPTAPYWIDWDFGDSSTHSSNQNPTHVYATVASTTTYTATVTIKDYYPSGLAGAGSYPTHSVSASVPITVYKTMTVTAAGVVHNGSGTSGVRPLTIDFTATPAGGDGNYSYFWQFGDGSTGTGAAPSKTYTTAGTYFAYVTVTDTSSHTATSNNVVVVVYDPLVATANANPSAGTKPLAVTFTAQANGGDNNYSYSWAFGSGASPATGTGALANTTYTTSGLKTATVTVSDGATPPHTTTASVNVQVYDPLTVSISSNVTSGTKPLAVTFTPTVAGGNGTYTYNWNFGDGTTSSTAGAVSKTYSNDGFFAVTLTVSDTASHVTTSNTINVTVWAGLTVALSATPNVGTLPMAVTFSAAANGGDGHYSYSYTYGDGSPVSSNPNHTYASAGNFTASVTVTDTSSHTAVSNNVSITVYAPLTASITSNKTSGVKPLAVTFTPTVAGGNGTYTYNWNFGDGTTGNTSGAVTKTYANDGFFSVTLTVTDTASHTVTSNTINITVWAALTATMSATPSNGTLPLAVTFTTNANGGDGIYSYSYNYGDGSAASSNPNHTYTAAGSYTCTVTVSDTSSHTTTATAGVTVWAPLTLTIAKTSGSGDTIPQTYTFSATAAGGNGTYSYSWNFGDGGTGTGASASHNFATAGTWNVVCTVTDTASHSAVSNTLTYSFYAPLAVSASVTPSVVIVGNSVTFNAVATGGNGVYSYAWTFGDSTTGTGATVNHVYATKGTYTAKVVVTDGVGHTVTSANLTVTVKPVPPFIQTSQKMQDPFRIKLFGTNFQSGCTATINGTAVTVSFKNGGEIVLKDCKSLCPKGVAVTIVVTNPDGGVSNNFQFTR